MVPARAFASPSGVPVEIIYDDGSPEASVGIAGNEILEVGSLYENYEVTAFEPAAIVLREQESEDYLIWHKEGTVSPRVLLHAQRLFLVKQLRLIYQAQQQYLEKYLDHYASDLRDLMDQGFLPQNFEKAEKLDYRFSIVQAGEAKRYTLQHRKEPLFWALAEPLKPRKSAYYFGVDQLGQVRYGRTRREVSWGPVWEYNQLNAVPSSDVIVHTEDSK